ncbi:cation diffusion facilitator family transporter [Castellaniella sp.]|uniref:cation diffusion facilitator family transporter n=1 Tax=Castellaniella sp. TaxID=1955812 RepID=UPI003561109B
MSSPPYPFPEPEERQRAAHRSTWISVWVNIVLTVFQMVVGVFAQSQALIADAIHSLSDLISDGVVLIANRHSGKGPDDDHPYGHLRFENAATLAVGLLLAVVGIGMLWRSAERLQAPELIPTVHQVALYVALMALMAKELLFRYLLHVARRVRSTMLVANAWHARSDAASSLVVALGIGANLAGLPLADPLAALIVGLMILRMGWKFAWQAFNDLVDRAVDEDTQHAIRECILGTPGVRGVHDLRTRKMGDMIWVEVDIEMDGQLTIEAGHAIAVEARRRVMADLPVLDVMTHFDPV